MSCLPANRKDTTVDQIARVRFQSRTQKRSDGQLKPISETDQKAKYFRCICSKERSQLYLTERERRCQKCAGSKISTSSLVENCLGTLRGAGIPNRYASSLFQSLNGGCIKRFCDGSSKRSKKLKKKLSTNTLHTADSLVDLRSWCSCEIQRRQYFMESIVVRVISKIISHKR